ncbi:origin recognition complex subunit 2 [Leucoraja erinacea]|uniref:origin recognition complex subunit 2 n=1 Tax=Leucoraja erinaceus TaxID=7782 RepID=UPI002454657E|nr:origin recognition complex subunit 2 [Leucoraja erinacea]
MAARSLRSRELRFVSDDDVLGHISERAPDFKLQNNVSRVFAKAKATSRQRTETQADGESAEMFNEHEYIEALGVGSTDHPGASSDAVSAAGGDVFTFQSIKRGNKMAKKASELAHTPGKSVTFDETNSPPTANKNGNCGILMETKTPSKRKKKFTSTTPYRLRKRLADLPGLSSESDYSSSDSEEGEDNFTGKDTSHASSLAPTPGKKSTKPLQPSVVELYFEAHSSSKVLTSDRTLQKLRTPKLDQETLVRLLSDGNLPFSAEVRQLNKGHKKLFHKWMLQTQLGFSILLYGLGSKRELLEEFRCQMLEGTVHLVVNGFFPSITLKSILNSITEEILQHEGSFRNPMDQLGFIVRSFNDNPILDLYLLIHNIDGQMLHGDRNQQILSQLAAIPGIHLLASIDHLNAPLMWDQTRSCHFNWLWCEVTTFKPYTEETSYENSLLVQQSGALALSSLTHVLRSLTPNARGIFKLLARFQLENRDNSSCPGLSFQDFYHRCRESFLVNSNLTLRAQLTEFKDHKLIRSKKGPDGVEYLVIPVDFAMLNDYLEKEDKQT